MSFTPFGDPPQPRHSCAGHLNHLIPPERLQQTVKLALAVLNTYEYDTLAFSGLSGLILGPILCYLTSKEMIAVRKENDNTHSFQSVEGYKHASRYIIIDDFICTGATVQRIVKHVSKFAPQAECLGVLECFYLEERAEAGRPTVLQKAPESMDMFKVQF